MDRKILVTGAGGFIGLHLCNHLADSGNRVVGIDLHYPKDSNRTQLNRFEAIFGDYRNQELMRKLMDDIDVVFHLAGAHLQIHLTDTEYWSINVHGLRPLMELARQGGVKRFIHVSSVGVYGNLETWPADEDSPCNPRSIYAKTKLAGEVEVKDFHRNAHLPAVILRPAWVYGPGCARTLKIYRALRKRRFAMIGGGHNLRHPIYIQDMLSAFILAMDSVSAVGETFIIGGNQTVTTRDLLDSFCSVLELPKIKLKLPMMLGKLAASGFETVFALAGNEPPVSRRSLEFFNTTNAFNISKAKRLLGFHPAYTLEEGLKESRAWLESQ